MGFWSFFFGGGSGGGSDLEYLGSDSSFDDATTEALYEGLDERDKTIAKLQKTSAIQHEIIVGFADQNHQHQIDRYEVIKKIAPGVANKFYIPGRCDPFPEIDFVAEVNAEKSHGEIHSDRHNGLPQTDAKDPWLKIFGD